MLSYSTTTLQKAIVHFVGNPVQEDPLTLAESELDVQPDHHEVLIRYLMHAFKPEAFYHFNVNGNPVYDACRQMFDEKGDFVKASSAVASHLFEVTTHPKILAGDLFVARLGSVNLHNEFFDAIAMVKAEQEDNFLQVEWNNNHSKLVINSAYRTDKIDKACLVLSSNPDDGYRVLVVDRTNGNAAEAQYWIDAFLDILAVEDNYHFTQQYMHIYKDFVKEQLPEEFEVNPAEQIAMLNRSSKYFKEKDKFELDNFAEEVIQQPEVVNAFKKYSRNYNEDADHSIAETFDISQAAVKKHAGMFKSVLKLDKNFHIYVHGNRQLIERGYDDERGMNYYKVYFANETTS